MHDSGWTGYHRARDIVSSSGSAGVLAMLGATFFFGAGKLRSRFFRWGGWLLVPLLLACTVLGAGAAMGLAVVEGVAFCGSHPRAPSCSFDLGSNHTDPVIEKTEAEWLDAATTRLVGLASLLAFCVAAILGLFWLAACGIGFLEVVAHRTRAGPTT